MSKSKKHIWIINEYAGSPKNGMTLRHFYLAKEFQKNNWNTTTISGSYSHILSNPPKLDNKVSFQKEKIEGLNFVWIKVFKYKSARHYKRILKWFYFTYKLLFIDKYIDNKPDYIICSPTAPFCIISAYYFKKKYKAKLVFEVRDIWPLSLKTIGNYSSFHPFIVFMKAFERFAIKKSDFLVSNLQFYNNYLKEEGFSKKAAWISNGIYLKEKQEFQKLPLDLSNRIPKDKFIIGYTGKLGLSNAMHYFLKAAKLIKNENIHFVIVGKGEEKVNLQKNAEGLTNITFIPQIPKNQINDMLSHFDVCYIGWTKKEMYAYGVSPNKIFDYMYASKPIIHSIQLKNEIIRLSNSGLTIKEESPEEIVRAINTLYEMPRIERAALGENGKKYALSHFTYEELAKKYIDYIS